jgi:hypothetical protein
MAVEKIKSFFVGRGKKKAKFSISSINIEYMGEVHSLPGIEEYSEQFEIKIPFSNKPQYDFIAKQLKDKNITIKGITVEKPFQLISIEPKLPCTIAFGSSDEFKLRIKAPSTSYYGPISIGLERDNESVVHLGISHISLLHNGKVVEIEDSAISTNVKAGEVIKVGVQLYRIMKHLDTVSSIKVGKPFDFAYSEPKLPIKLEDENSFVLEVFMNAPTFSYAGPIEIEFID